MNAVVRSVLNMVERVRGFCRAHPFTDPSATALEARFEERVDRAVALAVQQRSSNLAVRAANARRNKLRSGVVMDLLRHLVRVGDDAAKELPDLSGRLKLPPQDGSHQAFLAAARVMVSEAADHRDLLVKHGMTESMLDDLGQALNQYEQATETAFGATRERIGARSQLHTIAAELSDLVQLLNGLNRYRFREQQELLDAWTSAINVLGPSRGAPRPETEPPAGGEGGVQSAA